MRKNASILTKVRPSRMVVCWAGKHHVRAGLCAGVHRPLLACAQLTVLGTSYDCGCARIRHAVLGAHI